METALVTVVETKAFTASAKGRMKPQEVEALIDVIAAAPESGDLIQGTGGLRKIRFGVGGPGKRGSVRVVYYFYNDTMPVFLLNRLCLRRTRKTTCPTLNTTLWRRSPGRFGKATESDVGRQGIRQNHGRPHRCLGLCRR